MFVLQGSADRANFTLFAISAKILAEIPNYGNNLEIKSDSYPEFRKVAPCLVSFCTDNQLQALGVIVWLPFEMPLPMR